MNELIDSFFRAYWTKGMKFVYSDKTPKAMMQSEIDHEGWYEWRLVQGTLTIEDYIILFEKLHAKLPKIFIDWHRRYFFATCDCSIFSFPNSLPFEPLASLMRLLDNDFADELITLGLTPFADESNTAGLFVFDTGTQSQSFDYPIRFFSYDYYGDENGLSEVIFSSFEKMLECLTHFLIETKIKKKFEVIPDFYHIDPLGAGASGVGYWSDLTELERLQTTQ